MGGEFLAEGGGSVGEVGRVQAWAAVGQLGDSQQAAPLSCPLMLQMPKCLLHFTPPSPALAILPCPHTTCVTKCQPDAVACLKYGAHSLLMLC